jgi:hypothetical protein
VLMPRGRHRELKPTCHLQGRNDDVSVCIDADCQPHVELLCDGHNAAPVAKRWAAHASRSTDKTAMGPMSGSL